MAQPKAIGGQRPASVSISFVAKKDLFSFRIFLFHTKVINDN